MRQMCLFFMLLAALVLACSLPWQIPTQVKPTTTIRQPATAAVVTQSIARTGTPLAATTRTAIPTLTRTITRTPTISPTPMSLPSADSLRARFQAEVRPLIARLLAAAETTPTPGLQPDDPIILVPETERLHYVQNILFVERQPVTPGVRCLYVLYGYSRGTGLGFSTFGLVFTPTTQTVAADLRLVLQDGDRLILLEKKNATGGSGSRSHADLVNNAVLPFDSLGTRKTAVETDLQMVIGYASGINMDTRLDNHRRTVLFTHGLSSSAWADRRQSIEAFRDINPPPAAVGPLIVAALDDSSTYVRPAATETLKKFVAEGEAVSLVIEAARSPKIHVRGAAAEILGKAQKNASEALPALDRLLQDPEPNVRAKTANALGALGLPEAIEMLKPVLSDRDNSVRAAAVEALGNCGKSNPEAVLPSLSAALKDSNAVVRQKAAAAFGKLGAAARSALPDVLAALKAETDGPTFEGLASAAESLGGKADTLPILIEATHAPQAAIRLRACNALARYKGSAGVAEALIAALGDADRTVINAAVSALAVLGPDAKDATPKLIRLLEGEQPDPDRQQIINTLGKIGPQAKEAVPILIQQISHTSASVRTAAKTALKAITGVDYGEDKARWQEWWEENK